MRLATTTNWAYGITVALTLGSGATMLLASDAQEDERAAVAQRYQLDQATSTLEQDMLLLSGIAREYAVTGDPAHLALYDRQARALRSVESRTGHLEDIGAEADELRALREALRWVDALQDEQRAAIDASRRGDRAAALGILFGAEYEREIDRVTAAIERFQYRLDQRAANRLASAERVARLWRTTSEIVIAATGLLFLAVLFFILTRRILRPVVRLSDVVNRLAAQDYAAEPPEIDQIDEIGDMAQAIRGFRDNGLERQRLEQERQADRELRDLLSRMTQRMQGAETMSGLTEVVECFVPEIAPEFAGRLYLLDASRNALTELCSWLEPRHSRSEFAPMECWALRRGVQHRPAGKAIDIPCGHLDTSEVAPFDPVCLPLTAQRETIGLLYLERHADGGAARQTPEIYLTMLAENIGLAVSNLRLRDRLRDMAMADPLTGLANRRQLEAILALHLAEAQQHRSPLACLMLDVDHFKRFNDEFGHDAGDAVLREVAGVLRQSTRKDGLAFRYGGEEFLLLIPGIGSEPARERAEAIRERIASLRLRHEGRDIGPITASFGIAASPEHGPVERLVQTADAALLLAKEAGRNRVMTASASSEVGQAA